MLLKYDDKRLNAYFMCGLLEDVVITQEQRDDVLVINDLIESLKKLYAEMYASKGVSGNEELIEKTKTDEALKSEIADWLINVEQHKQDRIKKMVEKFNITYNESYAQYVKSLSIKSE